MGAKARLSNQAKITKAKKICKHYSEGEYTIATCCKAECVEYTTFQGWAQPNLTQEDIENGNYRRGFVHDVHVMYKKAVVSNRSNYKLLLKNVVRAGLLQRMRGMNVEEVQTTIIYDLNGNPIGTRIKKKEKLVLPDTSALIFIAKNIDEDFSDKKKSEVETDLHNPYENFTLQELRNERLRLEKMLESDDEY